MFDETIAVAGAPLAEASEVGDAVEAWHSRDAGGVSLLEEQVK